VRLEFAPPAGEDEDQTEKLFEFAAEQVRRHREQAPQCSLGVLVRTNAAVARMIYLLRLRDIPASEEGGNPLIDSPAVELVLSLLRLADHPADKVARFHLANSPLAAALELPDHRDAAAAARLARRIRRQLLDQGYGEVVLNWSVRLAEFCDARDQSRLAQLVELALEYQPASTLRTDDFIALVQTRRVADPSSADVRVMTIHQAKGLEFDIVVLPELGGLLAGQAEPVVAGRPGPTQPINVVCRYVNEDVRQFLSPALQRLFDDDRRRTVSESLCVLYVAMTRAAQCLHMVLAPPRSNERALPKTFGGILRATLAAGGQAAVRGAVYQHGDPKWFARLPPTGGARSRAAADAAPPAKITLAPPLAQRDRGWERTSPSSLEGGRHVSAGRLLESTSAAFEYGALVHAWLEHLRWLDDGLPDDPALLAIAARKAPEQAADAAALRDRLATLRQQLAQPQIAAVLRRSFYDDPRRLGLADSTAPAWKRGEVELAVQSERAFAVREGDQMVSGKIDRLVLIRRGGKLIAADILDFKTDTLPAGERAALAERIGFYRPQVEAYRMAAAISFRLDPRQITAQLIFLALGQVCRV
jgi:ATP-dependent exoDNAse (exonuclease V) beta subunit